MGTWLGVFPTVETLAAQAAAFAFVIGSYYLAEWVRKRQVRRPAPAEAAEAPAATNGSRPAPSLNGSAPKIGERRETVRTRD